MEGGRGGEREGGREGGRKGGREGGRANVVKKAHASVRLTEYTPAMISLIMKGAIWLGLFLWIGFRWAVSKIASLFPSPCFATTAAGRVRVHFCSCAGLNSAARFKNGNKSIPL